jgi:hypothetical protein
MPTRLYFAVHTLYGLSVYWVKPEDEDIAQRHVSRMCNKSPYHQAWWVDYPHCDGDVEMKRMCEDSEQWEPIRVDR